MRARSQDGKESWGGVATGAMREVAESRCKGAAHEPRRVLRFSEAREGFRVGTGEIMKRGAEEVI